MQLFKGILIVASLTPVCWVFALFLIRLICRTGLVGTGLDGIFDELQHYAWSIGVFLALLLAPLLSSAKGVLAILVIAGVLGLAVWAFGRVRGRASSKGGATWTRQG